MRCWPDWSAICMIRWLMKKLSTNDGSRFFSQIASLRHRLRLLAIVQTWSALAFIFNLSAMISLYFSIDSLGNWLFFHQSFWWLRPWFNSQSKSRLPTRPSMYIYQIWKNIKNGRIIWQHQNHEVRNHAKPCHLRRIELANIKGNQRRVIVDRFYAVNSQ